MIKQTKIQKKNDLNILFFINFILKMNFIKH